MSNEFYPDDIDTRLEDILEAHLRRCIPAEKPELQVTKSFSAFDLDSDRIGITVEEGETDELNTTRCELGWLYLSVRIEVVTCCAPDDYDEPRNVRKIHRTRSGLVRSVIRNLVAAPKQLNNTNDAIKCCLTIDSARAYRFTNELEDNEIAYTTSHYLELLVANTANLTPPSMTL